MALLVIRQLSKNFGGLRALSEFDLDVERNEIRGLIGPNGAGKSTLFNVISGVYKPDQGEVKFKDQRITGLRPDKVAAKGVVRTFQENMLFREMTVFDNVVLGCHLVSKTGFLNSLFNLSPARQDETRVNRKVMEILEFLDLAAVKLELAKNLPHGYQRLLGLAMALAADPEVLLLDEPVAGMSAEDIQAMTRHITRIRENQHVTIILVEHNVGVVTGLCDMITVLNYGRKIAEGLPGEIVNNPEVVKAYLGTENPEGLDASQD